jgi:GNAT superfamily N-acetyltransferase
VTWYPEDDSPEDLRLLESIARQGREIDDGIRFEVGRAHFVVADLLEGGLYDALDARESDLEYLAAVLFSKGDNDTYEIEEELLAPGNHAVLVNLVEIDPIWRGMKLGLLSTGVALLELGRGCSFAALDAMQPGVDDEARRRSIHKRLTWYWRQLGFDSWRERVMVLDLGATTLHDKMAELTSLN